MASPVGQKTLPLSSLLPHLLSITQEVKGPLKTDTLLRGEAGTQTQAGCPGHRRGTSELAFSGVALTPHGAQWRTRDKHAGSVPSASGRDALSFPKTQLRFHQFFPGEKENKAQVRSPRGNPRVLSLGRDGSCGGPLTASVRSHGRHRGPAGTRGPLGSFTVH